MGHPQASERFRLFPNFLCAAHNPYPTPIQARPNYSRLPTPVSKYHQPQCRVATNPLNLAAVAAYTDCPLTVENESCTIIDNGEWHLIRAAGAVAKDQLKVLRAELVKDDTCIALGIKSTGQAPVISLCRKLIEAGHEPATPLHAYRGNTLAIRVRSIGEAANLELASGGTFRAARKPHAAPPIRFRGEIESGCESGGSSNG